MVGSWERGGGQTHTFRTSATCRVAARAREAQVDQSLAPLEGVQTWKRETDLHHDGRQVGRRVSRSKEEGERRVDHEVDELGREEEHPERDLDWDEGEEDLKHPHELDRPLKAFDLVRVLLDERGREDIGPELRSGTTRGGNGSVRSWTRDARVQVMRSSAASREWMERSGDVDAPFRPCRKTP